jgi:hypothetical protein
MLSKVNSNYTPTFTVEELLSTVTFLNRFRIPFAVFGIVSFGMSTLWVSESSWNVSRLMTPVRSLCFCMRKFQDFTRLSYTYIIVIMRRSGSVLLFHFCGLEVN